ncbi:hypothetical protein BD560DRAFT_431458 [Blakeslea trispora]|nr:hypothetical protein BD560DRAFT_431458 [Blakeslea trispora]
MEGGSYSDQLGHNVWGGPTPETVPRDQPSDQQWQQVYNGFQQQYNLETEQLRRSMQLEHATIMENERQEWARNLDNLKNSWRDEANKILEVERENTLLKMQSFRSAFQQQLMDNAKEIAELEKQVSTLEAEKAQAYKEVELVSSRLMTRIQELEHLLSNKHMEMISEKEKWELKITRVQLISDQRGREIQQLVSQLKEEANQNTHRASTSSIHSSLSYQPRAGHSPIGDAYNSTSDSASVVTARAHARSIDASVASVPVTRMNVLKANESNSFGKSRHKLPTFSGAGGISAHQWLRQFKKLTSYYAWDERTALVEMQNSMTGEADSWFLHLPDRTKSTLATAKAAFQTNFGGEASERAKALTELQNLKKGGETMETFGPRIKAKILKVIPEESEGSLESHLSMLFPTLSEELVGLVSAQRPKTLTEAINIAMHIERGKSFAHRVKGSGKKMTVLQLSANTPNPLPKDNEDIAAMDLDVQRINAQNYKRTGNGHSSKYYSGNRSSNTTKTCYLCKKPGHLVKGCGLVKKNNHQYKKNHHTYRTNNQQVLKNDDNKGGSHQKINNADIDITNNLFRQVGGYTSNSQILEADDLIPTFTGGGSDPRSFYIPTVTEDGKTTECLMDTGAMMSSISIEEVHRLGLEVSEAPRVRLCYGNESIEYSDKGTRFEGVIRGVKYDSCELRIVKKQNVPIILGMDCVVFIQYGSSI